MLVSKKSMMTGKINTMDLPIGEGDLERFEKSELLIQQFFSHLSADQREFILTGSTPEEWDECFKEVDEVDSPD